MASQVIFVAILVCFCSGKLSFAQTSPDNLLLKDFRPRAIYKIPVTKERIKPIPVIDMHSHAYANDLAELNDWVVLLRKTNVTRTIILTGATGSKFDSIYSIYSQFGDLFEIWCGFDYTGWATSDWPAKGLKEIERCYRTGARGVGELGDKGSGEMYSHPAKGDGIHIDDNGLKPLLKRCGELKMPVSVHVAEPAWMYEPMDSTNDGLPNSFAWRIDRSANGFKDHQQLITTLENAAKNNPGTTFIACHFANCESDLSVIGNLLEKYANLYADIAARYGETSTIPRYMKAFYQKHAKKLLYGTDMGMDASMYDVTFRILESADEHFYETDLFNYHWACNGLDLDNKTLKALYHKNAQQILKR
jgi:predicted TIM-barrel fold metal-dependent hydrolase